MCECVCVCVSVIVWERNRDSDVLEKNCSLIHEVENLHVMFSDKVLLESAWSDDLHTRVDLSSWRVTLSVSSKDVCPDVLRHRRELSDATYSPVNTLYKMLHSLTGTPLFIFSKEIRVSFCKSFMFMLNGMRSSVFSATVTTSSVWFGKVKVWPVVNNKNNSQIDWKVNDVT